MTDRAFLSVFTPSRTAPEDLDAIFVQRQAMLADAVERVRESATTGNKHHLLFVGPRGTGKTHLVTLLVHRLGQDPALKDRLHIAWLNEDETSTTLLEFLRRIYLALVKRYPGDYSGASLEPIYDLDADAAESRLARLLLERLGERTLLVVVENLDALFEGLGVPGQQRLRAFIQEHPVLAIVATAQRLVDDISKRNSVFFGFFQTEPLETLSAEQAAELLGKIASLNRQPDVAAFLRTPTGRSRIRALHHLSGGNHRIYIVLSQFITGDNIDGLVAPFCKMIDEMTPYYQERIRWLPPQQRKIVEYLCSRERPVPVKELAKRLFATPQTISSQLKDLRGKGYVQAAQRGRESLYEIAEPLMRICVEVKENQSPEPLRLLVDFLRVWYDATDLSARLQGCDDGSMAHAYLQAAIEQNSALGNLRAQLLVEGFRTELADERHAHWLPLIEAYAQESEELAFACGEWAKGKADRALNLLAEISDERSGQSAHVRATACLLAAQIHYEQGAFEWAIKALDPIPIMPDTPAEQLALALYNRGWAHGQLGEYEKAIADYSAVIGLPDAPAERVAKVLNNRGLTYRQLGEYEKAIADFSAVISLPEASIEQVRGALYNRGVIYGQLGKSEKAIADYSAVIDLPNSPAEQIATALNNRGVVHGQFGESKKAIADFNAVIGLLDAPVKQIAIALNNRGVAFGQFGNFEKAIADFSAVIGLPNAPAEQVAPALNNRGLVYWQFGEREKAITDYNTVIDFPDASVEDVAKALYNRGVAHAVFREYEKAIADFSAVINLPDAPIEGVARALLSRGLAHGQLSESEKALADYSAVIGLPDAPVEQVALALHNRGVAHRQFGESEKAIADYSAVIDLANAPVEEVATALINRALVYRQLGEPEKAIAEYSAVIGLPDASVEQVAIALYIRGATYWQIMRDAKHSEQDFETLLGLPETPITSRVAAFLALAVIRIVSGRWESALSALAEGLTQGAAGEGFHRGDSEGIIAAFFESSLTPAIRQERTRELARLYQEHNALPLLGEALTRHLGSLRRAKGELPTADNLELWASAWEQAGQEMDALRMPLRIFRTGIDFLKTGGQDRGILLDLNQEERRILEQALGLDAEG